MSSNRVSYAIAFVLLCIRLQEISSFTSPSSHPISQRISLSAISLKKEDTIDSLFGPRIDDGEDEVLYSDEDNGDGWGAPSASSSTSEVTVTKKKAISRWDSLNPKIKARIVKEGQERAIRNKKKREPAEVKKRRE